jgi:Na+/proline symporter
MQVDGVDYSGDDVVADDDTLQSFYEEGKYACGPVPDNLRGSYLTMVSLDGLRFGIINLIGNFGTVFVDQSYWQSAIAAKPAAAHKGYMLGGMVWFTIPFTLATSMGLTSLALQLPVTNIESGNGLVPAAVAVHLFDAGGAWMIAIMLFMAIISTGSAEAIAVSSLVAYDIYRQYINPNATGKQILKVSRIAIFAWGIFMGVLSALLQLIAESEPMLGLGWVYTFMGNAIGSAVIPLSYLLLWKDANAIGAILGAWIGLILAIVTWCIHAGSMGMGGITVESLGTLDACLTGNLVAICSSGLIHTVLSLMSPQKFDFTTFDEKIVMCEAEDTDLKSLEDEDYGPEKLAEAKSWIMKWGITLTVVLFIIWPLLSIPAGVFTKDYFAFWIFIALAWGFIATATIIILPLYEAKDSILNVLSGMTGIDFASKETKEEPKTEVAMSAVGKL